MSLEQIHSAIPHRDPFLLVDEICDWQAESIHCAKTLSGDEFWFAGHYPGFPIMPGVLLVEAAMQAGAILLSKLVPDDGSEKVPVATRVNKVRFKQMVRPGDRIEMNVNLTEQLSGAFFLDAKVTVNKKVAVRFDFACTLAQPEST